MGDAQAREFLFCDFSIHRGKFANFILDTVATVKLTTVGAIEYRV